MVSVNKRPVVDAAAAAALAADVYGARGVARELPSERDRNFHVVTDDGRAFVLKVANTEESEDWLICQNQVLALLAAAPGQPADASPFPRVCANNDGEKLTRVECAGEAVLVRLLTHLPGEPLAHFRPRSAAVLAGLGGLLGRLDTVLRDFDHPALHRDFHWDLVHAGRCFARRDEVFEEPERRALLGHFAQLFEEHAAPHLSQLPCSAIHSDANDYNVLVEVATPSAAPRLSLIDFGDMVHSCTAGEVAVACAYALLDQAAPLRAAGAVLAGYHEVAPLSEHEVAALFPLIGARLCMSVTHAATQRALAPDNSYLSVSEDAVWRALQVLRRVHPRFAHYALRRACGWTPNPRASTVRAWMKAWQRDAPGLGAVLSDAPRVELDLSIGSPDLPEPFGIGVEELTARVFGRMAAAGARVGIGRYDEARPLYSGEHFGAAAGLQQPQQPRRTVHLGIDLFAAAGTVVACPLEGVVHSTGRNEAPLDYGPTIILEHRPADGPVFYTLYGHLSGDSLEGLTPGQSVARGATLARLGAPTENGGWPPHLHFQVVTDMLGCAGDFPGVADPDDRELWLDLCPDPRPLLGIEQPGGPVGLSAGAILEERRQRLGPSLSIAYHRPLHIVRGAGTRLYDADGRAYLDCANNVCHVGHCHPAVVAAGARQMAVLNTNTRYLHESIVRYAERLAALFPDPLSVCFFVCSGSEANELAIRMARAHTGQRDVVVLEAAYHGNTSTLVDLSPYKHDGPGGEGAPEWVRPVPLPDSYRGLYRGSVADIGRRYAQHVGDVVAEMAARDRRPAAFLCEALLGCGGQIVLPDGYLREAYRHVRAAGGVCIADEVQIGFGRVGSALWGFETQGVVPDIVTLGKPIGNGHPLAAVVTTPEIARSFASGMEYFNTFGGNPVSCEIGLAVLDVLEGERLPHHAEVVGQRLLAGLRELQGRFPLIGDVRGLGLFVGIELVLDLTTREPAPEHTGYVAERLRDHGILLGVDGPDHNVLKIKPPLVFSAADADRVVATLSEVLGESPLQ